MEQRSSSCFAPYSTSNINKRYQGDNPLVNIDPRIFDTVATRFHLLYYDPRSQGDNLDFTTRNFQFDTFEFQPLEMNFHPESKHPEIKI